MTRRTRIAAAVVGAGVGALVATGAVLAWTFSGLGLAEDGRVLPGGARLVKDGYVSCFLVPTGNGRFLLVDAGNDATGAAIDRQLAAAGAGRDAVDAVLLTHGHPDHTAACSGFPNATVYALSDEVPLLEGKIASRGPLTRWFGAMHSPCGEITAVSDGDTIPIGDAQARVFAVPGHTAGSAAWWVSGVVYFGDAADALSGGALVPAKWLFTDDPDEASLSIVALASKLEATHLDVQALAFSHSGVLDGPDALSAYAAAHAR